MTKNYSPELEIAIIKLIRESLPEVEHDDERICDMVRLIDFDRLMDLVLDDSDDVLNETFSVFDVEKPLSQNEFQYIEIIIAFASLCARLEQSQ